MRNRFNMTYSPDCTWKAVALYLDPVGGARHASLATKQTKPSGAKRSQPSPRSLHTVMTANAERRVEKPPIVRGGGDQVSPTKKSPPKKRRTAEDDFAKAMRKIELQARRR